MSRCVLTRLWAGIAMAKQPLLDLHGYKTDQVPDAVDRFLNLHMKKNTPRVCIMPGKGSGAVKKAVIDYLRLGGFPWEYERLPSGARNEGVLVVILD